MITVRIRMAVVLASLAAVPAPVAAGENCCHCGSGCGVRKVCRLVCETKKIKDYCYGCKCDAICLPGKSCRGCLHCDDVCASCGQCGCDCGCDHKPLCHLEWYDWKPGCADMLHIKKLVKYEVEREVCSFKWVVEEVCDGCCHECDRYHPCDAEDRPAPDAGLDAPTPEQGGPPVPPQARSPGQG